MSMVIPIERDPHATVQALLPWYARQQLDDAEMDEVRAHLVDCPRCRAELETEQALRALLTAMPPLASGGDVEAGLARMRARIATARPARAASAPRAAAPSVPRWFGWLLGVQGGAIAALALLLVWPQIQGPTGPDEPGYRGLSSAAAAQPTAEALVMFKPTATEREIRAALQASGATVVGGPTENGAWLLRLARDAQALQRLRAAPGVALAESLEPRR